MIKIVSFKICPFVQRVTAALEAKNIPYQIEYISLSDKPQWFLDVSPNGQVPILIAEDNSVLFESDAIIEYISDKYGAFDAKISHEQRALERAWSYLAAKNYLVQCGVMSSKSEQQFNEKKVKLLKDFAKVEAELSGDTQFFRSNEIGTVDIAWLPLLHRAAIISNKSGFDFLDGMPKMQAWQAALLDTGLVEKSVSDDFEPMFCDFYLINTFLAGDLLEDHSQQCKNKPMSSCCG
ncbi:glutathione S-transferase family protein [Vibrio sp. SS-MA-C1-2]|uniref:glutathione S-transferase family protein n=1 Tax=Vibrio sp. SS-MA-C1-2 TaxID=2908646 RepID=UPI001F48C5B8|nr:glutathione S-transferase family protein [Vibrio sp. SS-MA-C1-2]UJF19736.1 glutathione S-transferase family protein [Vibrio sp. SS-MA-C1-2]